MLHLSFLAKMSSGRYAALAKGCIVPVVCCSEAVECFAAALSCMKNKADSTCKHLTVLSAADGKCRATTQHREKGPSVLVSQCWYATPSAMEKMGMHQNMRNWKSQKWLTRIERLQSQYLCS